MFAESLRVKLEGICDLSAAQIEGLRLHYELLARWNRVLNLTSRRTIEDSVERHYCESLFAACQLPDTPISLADIGSGGGFPGIPIAIVRRQCSVTLIESHQRKAAFLKEASRALANVRVVARRAEDITERFDWAVSRAVLYSGIAATLKSMASHALLLAGELPASGMPEFDWDPPIQLPWGDRRFVWIGHATVSRETTD